MKKLIQTVALQFQKMQSSYLILMLVAGEVFANFLFWVVSKIFHGREGVKISKRSVFKGIIDRVFIFFSPVYNLPYALTVLGALKVAARRKDEKKISNNYFLVGNLLSITVAIAYFIIWQDVLK